MVRLGYGYGQCKRRAAFRLHERAVAFGPVAHRAQPTEYKQVEVVAVRKETIVGDFVEFSAEKRGTVLSAEHGNIRLIEHATTKRFCLANIGRRVCPRPRPWSTSPARAVEGEEFDSTNGRTPSGRMLIAMVSTWNSEQYRVDLLLHRREDV